MFAYFQRMTGKRSQTGFTLIELLVVIAIIGVLASIVVASLSSSREAARDTRRVADMNALRTAIEVYRSANGTYPITGGEFSKRADCDYPTNYIPGLVPDYVAELPNDCVASPGGGYVYRSDGTDYKIVIHPEGNIVPQLLDPEEEGDPPCLPPGSGHFHYALWSSDVSACWPL
jgi:general secretion pathway protein G